MHRTGGVSKPEVIEIGRFGVNRGWPDLPLEQMVVDLNLTKPQPILTAAHIQRIQALRGLDRSYEKEG